MDSIKKYFYVLFFMVALVLVFQGFTEAKATAKGVILGYIFEMDGTTPVEGAFIKVKNSVTGAELLSSTSDHKGTFQITGIESGIYEYAVVTSGREFVSDSAFGVKMKESGTAKLAINIKAYDKEVEAAIADMPAPREIEGETFIGRVVDFDLNTQMAEVFIMQGRLEWDDKIHALGETTDFYQKVESLAVGEFEARAAMPGQTALIQMENVTQIGDAVYVAASRIPFAFLAPLAGVATVVAGSSMVAYNIGQASHIPDWCEPCSPFKPDAQTKKRKKNR